MNMMNEDDLYKVCIDQENGEWTVMAWCRFLGYAKSICEACQDSYRRYSYAIFKGNELIEEYPADENQY